MIKVKARDGVKVPYEHRANQYIESEAVELPATPYYLRQIKAGDLIEVEVKSASKKPVKPEKKEIKDGE